MRVCAGERGPGGGAGRVRKTEKEEGIKTERMVKTERVSDKERERDRGRGQGNRL